MRNGVKFKGVLGKVGRWEQKIDRAAVNPYDRVIRVQIQTGGLGKAQKPFAKILHRSEAIPCCDADVNYKETDCSCWGFDLFREPDIPCSFAFGRDGFQTSNGAWQIKLIRVLEVGIEDQSLSLFHPTA